jgi:hypothetical protein
MRIYIDEAGSLCRRNRRARHSRLFSPLIIPAEIEKDLFDELRIMPNQLFLQAFATWLLVGK